MIIPTDFELDQWLREAKRMITCTACYGSGEDRWQQGHACEICQGAGRSIAEPHVVRLVEEVYRVRAIIDSQAD